MLESQFQPTAPVVVQENCLVLNTGDKLVLFDSGMGSYKAFGPTAGRLESTLAASGIKSEDIDAIILTHGHIDHLSGIMGDDGNGFFPMRKSLCPRSNMISGPMRPRRRRPA